MRSRVFILIAAAGLGLLAAFAAWQYLAAVRNQAVAGAKLVGVLVAKEDIPKGMTVAEMASGSKTETRMVPQQYLASDAVSTLRAIDGQVLAIPLAKGEQLTAKRFQFSADAGLSFTVPKGMVAVSLPSDENRGVAGLIKSGDNVAVYVTAKMQANDENSWRTKVLVPGARVLAAGRSTGVEAKKDAQQAANDSPLGSSSAATSRQLAPTTITMALTPADAARVVFSQEIGRVWLALLPTEQKAVPANTPVVIRGSLMK